MNELVTLTKIEQSKLAIREVKTLEEIKTVIDQGEALRAYAKSAKLAAEIQADIAELNLIAERRLGELSAAMEKAKVKRQDTDYRTSVIGNSKTERLSEAGIDIRRANEAEKLTAIEEGVFHDLLQTAKEIPLPKAAILKIAGMEPEKQKAVVQKIASGEAKSVVDAQRQVLKETILAGYDHKTHTAEGRVDIFTTPAKYRVIYADPPWTYGDPRSGQGTTGAQDHYPAMPLQEICALPIKQITEDNAVLFLWATSPLLEECFEVIRAWGFTYKASFVWDKVKHNLGHYNSVRHEFLLVGTRGSCVPDTPTLYDSVQTIERTEHSRKPETFRGIIDALYRPGCRLELFARTAAEGWDAWGYEAP